MVMPLSIVTVLLESKMSKSYSRVKSYYLNLTIISVCSIILFSLYRQKHSIKAFISCPTEWHGIIRPAIETARIRLRPILMTAFAFILGVLPLVLAGGAGASSRHSLGTAVFGGMIASTFLSLIVVPVFYVLIEELRERRVKEQKSRT